MIKVIKVLVAIAGLALAIYGFWYMQFAPLAADNGHGVVYACKGDEKYGYTEGGTAFMYDVGGGVGYQRYEDRKYHAYACEREYKDRSKRATPLIAVGGTVMLVALVIVLPTRRK